VLRRRPLPREQLLALRAALLPGPEAVEAFAEWRRLVDFDATDAPAYRLLPLIYRNLEDRLGADPVLGRMRGVYRRTWVLNAITLGEGRRAVAALDREAIPTMLLKGAAMVARWTGDSGVRMMADFDVLVPRDRALEAVALLLEDGWKPAIDRPSPLREGDLDDEHALALRSESGGELDLHWRALMHGGDEVSGDELWGRSEAVDQDGVTTRVPSAEDHVHQACSHATTWTAAGRVDWIADSGLIVERAGPGFDWRRVFALARLDRSSVAVATLTAALSDVLDMRVPPRGTHRGLAARRPAISQRVEISLRGRTPDQLSRAAELFLDLQEHRRRSAELERRPLLASIPSYAKRRWRVEGVRGAVAQAAYAALGRPHWLRRSVVRRVRSHRLDASRLVGLDAGSLDLRVETDVGESLLRGWSFAEAEGRWTDGSEATLALRTAGRTGDLAIDVMGTPLLHPRHPGLDVEIWANDRYVDTWSYRIDEAAAPGRVLLPSGSIDNGEVLELGFVFRDPCRPMELGLSDDPRRLGLFVRELRFSPA
jgi:Uncharacterised nucleotidyltransferase